MASGFDYTAHEDSLDGPQVGTYHHDGSNGLAGPEHGDIIRLEGQMGRWRVTAGKPLATALDAATSQSIGKLAVERVEDDLVAPHGD
jgi:hypothetical protein